MKKNLLFIMLIHFCFTLQAQDGLKFKKVFNVTIKGEKVGVIDMIEEKEFTVEKGTVVKISSSSISEISGFDGTPNVLSSSSQGMVFINDMPVTNMPEANMRTVEFPIWLTSGGYKLKLVAHTNNVGKKLIGVINGLVYTIE